MRIRKGAAWLAAVGAICIHGTAHADGWWKHHVCARIGDGTITTSDGEPIELGFDEWGYDYQAHLFHGAYCDAARGGPCAPDGEGVTLTMKWNDAWLSNRDCDGDGHLDRHRGFKSYIGSGARIVNWMSGSYELDGQLCHWRQRTKIVAAPWDAELVDGMWIGDCDQQLGPVIWEEFIVVDRDLFDPCGGVDAEALSAAGEGE